MRQTSLVTRPLIPACIGDLLKKFFSVVILEIILNFSVVVISMDFNDFAIVLNLQQTKTT